MVKLTPPDVIFNVVMNVCRLERNRFRPPLSDIEMFQVSVGCSHCQMDYDFATDFEYQLERVDPKGLRRSGVAVEQFIAQEIRILDQMSEENRWYRREIDYNPYELRRKSQCSD